MKDRFKLGRYNRKQVIKFGNKIFKASNMNPDMTSEFRDTLFNDQRKHDQEERSYDPSIFSAKKVIISGDILEVWNFEKKVRFGARPKKRKYIPIDEETGEIFEPFDDYKDPEAISTYDPEKGRADNARRTKWEFRRTVISNFDNNSKFFTLTFRDDSVKDVKDVAECNHKFRNFIKKMRRRYDDFKYCAVIEFQDDPKYRKDGIPRGAVHYHVVANIPYVHWSLLTKIWGNGTIDITAIDHVDNVGAYISKYMAKNANDPRLKKLKSYQSSHNIDRPIVSYGAEAEELCLALENEQKKVFTNSYESEYQGKTVYKEYNLKRNARKDGDLC